ncbi:ROK family transcriptional regulator [Gryllotalpicola kribbensis]|uniref:ROK family transcriptional regulator n=2 Tax=Gryllotalpicola kribbensis TaxID=993084 RepID=A0ABP8AWE7_9MICO
MKGQSSAETRSAILDLIRSSGSVSRSELAVLSGLTEATISKIVKTLLDQELVIEAGFADSTGGKRPVLLTLNTKARYAIGVSLDARSINYVVSDMSGHAVHHLETEGFGHTTPPLVIKRMAGDIAKLVKRSKLAPGEVVGIGVAAAGRLDASGGVLRRSRVASDWEDFAIEAALHDATGMRVALDNDGNCAALGEFWSQRLPADHDFAVVYMATGIGCGLVIDGGLYRGASGNVGEIGHMTVDLNGPECFCGRRGCLETLAAPAAVVARARANEKLAAALGLEENTAEDDVRADFALIARAAAEGDAGSVALLTESAEYLATAVVSMANLLDLDTVYLGGPGFADAGELYAGTLRRALENGAFMRAVHPVEVRMSSVGAETSALGAASLMLHSHLTPFRAGRG